MKCDRPRRNVGDIITAVLTIAAFALIAVYVIIRMISSAAAFADAIKNIWVLAFLSALCLLTMIIYFIFRKKERGGKWAVLHYSITAAGGILLIAGFILMCTGVI